MGYQEWRWKMKERSRRRWEDRHFPPAKPVAESEPRPLAHEMLSEPDVVTEEESSEQEHAPMAIEALSAERRGYRSWLARKIAADAAEDYAALVTSLREDAATDQIAEGREGEGELPQTGGQPRS